MSLHIVPIYFVDVLVYVYNGKEFVKDCIIKKVMIKGFGKKYILAFRHDYLKKMTSKEISLSKGHEFKIKDIRLYSQHGFGIKDF